MKNLDRETPQGNEIPPSDEKSSCGQWYRCSLSGLTVVVGFGLAGLISMVLIVADWWNQGFLTNRDPWPLGMIMGVLTAIASAALLATGVRDARRSRGASAGKSHAGARILVGGYLFCSILAAMIVPNFLHSSSANRLLHVRADMKQVGKALASYCRDRKTYPGTLGELTTPVAYLDAWREDGFSRQDPETKSRAAFVYAPFCGRTSGSKTSFDACALVSIGPDGELSIVPERDLPTDLRLTREETERRLVGMTYDPTNGTNSRGDLYVLSGFDRK